MAQRQTLYLHQNQIGDEGMSAFSTALASGAWQAGTSQRCICLWQPSKFADPGSSKGCRQESQVGTPKLLHQSNYLIRDRQHSCSCAADFSDETLGALGTLHLALAWETEAELWASHCAARLTPVCLVWASAT
eukprot:4289072-Prymnesium_polylepis.2